MTSFLQLTLLDCFTRSKLDQNSNFKPVFLTLALVKVLSYKISIDLFRFLFVVQGFALKTEKQRKQGQTVAVQVAEIVRTSLRKKISN